MLAVLNHRASAYEELHHARTRLMTMRQMRSGLVIKKGGSTFSCHALLSLLADIAAAKFNELRLMLSLELFEQQLREEKRVQKRRRIWLGSTKPVTQDTNPEPRRTHRHKPDALTTFLLARLWVRSLQKPQP